MDLPFTIKTRKEAEASRRYYHNKLFYLNEVKYSTNSCINIPVTVHRPFTVFFYTLQGTVEGPVSIRQNHYRAFYVQSGEHKITVPPGRHHYHYILPENTLLQKIIKSNPALQHLNEYALDNNTEYHALPLKPINDSIRRILMNLQSKKGNNMHSYVDILHGIHQLTTIYGRQLADQPLPNQPEFIVEQVKEYFIREIKAGRIPSLRKIIQEHPISSRTFFNYFKEQYGLSPHDFINSEKMNLAHNLIVKEKMRIKDVSALLGYSSQSTFAVRFRKHFGYTPTEAPNEQ